MTEHTATPSSPSNESTQTDELIEKTSVRPQFSVILPVYNEEGNLDVLYSRLKAVFQEMDATHELLFVDDGSVDQSWPKLQELQEADPSVAVVKFSRNFGHHLACTSGLDYTRGEFVVLMDSDLQDQPEEIPKLYAKMQEGYDVVFGIRKNKKFSVVKRFLSWSFRLVMKKLIGYPIEGGIYRMMRRQVVEKVRECREVDRIVLGLINWVGFRQIGVEVEHAPRVAGETSYTFRKQLQLAANAITAFSTAPLRIASYIGSLLSGVALLGSAWALLYSAFSQHDVSAWTFLLLAVIFLGGIQLICLGVIGEYLGRIFHQTRERPLYVIEAYLSSPLTEQSQETD